MRRFIFAALLSIAAISLLSSRSFAQSCPAGQDNMLDWMTLDTATSQHLTGPQALPLYSVLPSDGLFWLVKGDQWRAQRGRLSLGPAILRFDLHLSVDHGQHQQLHRSHELQSIQQQDRDAVDADLYCGRHGRRKAPEHYRSQH